MDAQYATCREGASLSQNLWFMPACFRQPFAVCRDFMDRGTVNVVSVIGLYQTSCLLPCRFNSQPCSFRRSHSGPLKSPPIQAQIFISWWAITLIGYPRSGAESR